MIVRTIVVMLLCMPIIHAISFGIEDLGTATFYYWLIGIPILAFIVPAIGFSLSELLRILGLKGFAAVAFGTVVCGLVAGLAISSAHGVIPEVIALAAIYGGIGGFVWTTLAQREQR